MSDPLIDKVLGDPSKYPAAFSSFLQRYISGNSFIQIGGNQLPDVEKIRLVGGNGNPAFLNSWVNYGSGWQEAGFYKDAYGIVHLCGVITAGTIGTIAFALPTGYRPAAVEWFPAIMNGGIGSVVVDTSGNVTPDSGVNTEFSISGISFRSA